MPKPVLRTRKEWFETLGEPTSIMAIQNTKAKNLKEKCINLSAALQEGFLWADTTEGHQYWEDIYLDIGKGKKYKESV